MTLWDAYEIFDPQVEHPLAEVTPAEARAHFKLVLETKEHRVQELRKLARAAGIELDGSEDRPGWFSQRTPDLRRRSVFRPHPVRRRPGSS
jgi:hypothetical protein